MNKKSGSGLFMMEMIVVVFFFMLCAGTCIMAFAKANSMSRLAEDTNKAVLLSQSIAEVWKAEGDEGLKKKLGAIEQDGAFMIFRGRDWEEAEESGAEYSARIAVTEEDSLLKAEITVNRGQQEIYSLEAGKYDRPDS